VQQPKELEDYEPEYREIPELFEQYGIKLDKNHPLEITSDFVMEQIIVPDEARYRTDSIMKGAQAEDEMPNWFIYLKMEECSWCKVLQPSIDSIARQFNDGEGKFNYIVASIDCGKESGVFMCQYFDVTRLPKFIVLRPETETRFFKMPLAYRKNPYNLWRFAVDFWSETYTSFDFPMPNESVRKDDWQTWTALQVQEMLEEAAGFFLEWGFEWVPYWQLFGMTMFLLFGPFLMCLQTYKLWKWMEAQKAKDGSKSVEEDPDFVQDPDAPDAPFVEGEGEGEGDDDDDAAVPVTAASEESKAASKPKAD